MAEELKKFRAKYPQYNDIDDGQLVTMLAKKYPDAYGDLPGKYGLQPKSSGTTLSFSREGLNKSQLGAAEELFKRGKINLIDRPMSVAALDPAQALPAAEGGMYADGLMSKRYTEPAAMIGKAIATDPIPGLAALRTLLETGDVDQATKVVKQAQELLQYKFESEEGKKGAQALGETLTPIVEPIKKVYEKAGDIGYEVAGPLGGAAVKTALAAIPEVLGLKGTRAAKKAAMMKKLGARAEDIYDETGNILPEFQRGLDEQGISLSEVADILPAPKKIARQDEIMAEAAQEIGGAAKARFGQESKALRVAEEALPDREILDAITDLGVESEFLASHVSKNPTFRALEQGLKKIPGSQLAAKEKVFIGELGKKADNLIEEFGGEIDKSLLSEKFRVDSKKLIDDLSLESSALFGEISKNIPSGFSVKTDNIIDSIKKRADEFGGTEYLEPLELELLKKLDPATKPTYARLDNLRKKIGKGLNNKGPFKDADEGALKSIYKSLAKDQMEFAKSQGWGDTYKTANSLVVQRKGVEDQLVKTIGKDIAGDIAAKGRGAMLDLQKGGTKLFNELSENIPKELGKDMRKSIFATALNDAFVQGSRAERSLNIPGFDDFMKGLNRHPSAKKMLTKEIGKDAVKRLETMHKVVGGVRAAMAEVGQVPRIFDSADNIASKLYGVGKMASFTKGAMIGAVETVINAKRTPRSVAADDLLSSSKFIDIIKRSAAGGLKTEQKINRANDIIKNMKEFKKWKSTVKEKDILDALTVNAVGYLTGETVKEK